MRLKRTTSSTVPRKKQSSHHSFSIRTTGHRQEQCVEAYDSRNEDEQRQVGNIIHLSTAKLSRLESEQVEFPSPVLQLVVDTFTNFHNCNVVVNSPRAGLWSNASSFSSM